MDEVLEENVKKILADYSGEGRVFFNEAHFQYEFTISLYNALKSYKYRFTLEKAIKTNKASYRVDLLVTNSSGEKYVFEFKYLTTEEEVNLKGGLTIFLKNQQARNIFRYRSWRDISKIENLKEASECSGGYFLLITNDSNLKKKVEDTCQDYRFTMNVGVQPSYPSPLEWRDKTKSTAKKYPNSINIRNKYEFKYYSYKATELGNFEYLIVKI